MAWSLLSLNTRTVTILVVLAAYFAYRYLIPPRIKSPIIQTSLGYLQGSVSSSKSRDGREFYEYLGIPFAAPPVHELRFAPPQPPKSWSGVRDASVLASPCLQNPPYFRSIHGDEDCLYLNVYVPKLAEQKPVPMPVMVWLHGGHFSQGSPQLYRPHYWMDENIVLVTVAYRLNSLGFLDSGDGLVRGNMGLKDQVTALHWIRDNIAAFGGDPGSVTLLGQSAGAVSAHFHMLSPLSRGLFHKVIAQSGTALISSWSMSFDRAAQAKRLAGQLNCPTDRGNAEMVSCMRKVPAMEIMAAHDEMKDVLRDPRSFYVPSIETVDDEHAFITKHPRELLDKDGGKGIPLLLGVTSEEGSAFWGNAIRDPETKAKLCDPEFWSSRILDLNLVRNDEGTRRRVVPLIRDHYFGPDSDICDVDGYRSQFISLYSHPMFFTPFDTSVRAHARHSPTYAYYFDHIGAASLVHVSDITGKPPLTVFQILVAYVKNWILEQLWYGPVRTGVSHADDLHYQWVMTPLHKESDLKVSRALVKMFAQFATDDTNAEFLGKKLKPIPASIARNTSEPLPVLEISLNPKYISFPHSEDVKFWNSLQIL